MATSTGSDGIAELARRFQRGDFDMIAVGRAVLTDPDYVKKIRDGRFGEVKKTIVPDEIRSRTLAKS
jgi:2,4-dienoyl-CoA reductase-like NADH-dependent reductase (Old Yellow Enzyme family)